MRLNLWIKNNHGAMYKLISDRLFAQFAFQVMSHSFYSVRCAFILYPCFYLCCFFSVCFYFIGGFSVRIHHPPFTGLFATLFSFLFPHLSSETFFILLIAFLSILSLHPASISSQALYPPLLLSTPPPD